MLNCDKHGDWGFHAEGPFFLFMDELSRPRFFLIVIAVLLATVAVFGTPTQEEQLKQAVKDMPKAVTPSQQ